MIKDKYYNYLLNVYQEIHSHHREQTNQNNQIITFYLALISFFIGFYNKLTTNYNTVVINCIFIIVIIIGAMVNVMLIQLRVWQLRYATALQLLGSMFLCDREIESYSDFYVCINQFECRSNTKHSLFKPLTCKMIWACLAISLTPFGLYYTYLRDYFIKYRFSLFIIFVMLIILYITAIYSIFKNKIKDVGNKGEINWLLDYINFN